MKLKDLQAPVLFSCTFKALNLEEKIQVLSRMRGNPADRNNAAGCVHKPRPRWHQFPCCC